MRHDPEGGYFAWNEGDVAVDEPWSEGEEIPEIESEPEPPPANDRAARLHRALDYVLDHQAGHALDNWEEQEHPRARSGSEAGRFVKKGSGGLAGGHRHSEGPRAGGAGGSSEGGSERKGLKKALVAPVAKYDESRFKPLKAGSLLPGDQKVPGGWRPDSVYVNPDPKGDVFATGTQKKSSKKVVLMSKTWAEKNKAFREENWEPWQVALRLPADSREVWLASDPKADKQAVHYSTTGVPYVHFSAPYLKRRAKEKQGRVGKVERDFESKIWPRLQKDVKSKDPDIRDVARASSLTALTGARIGGTIPKERTKKAKEFVRGALFQITKSGSTDFKALGAPSNKVGTRFRPTGPGAGTGEAALLKDWEEEPTTKTPAPKGFPKALGAALEQSASGSDVTGKGGWKSKDHKAELDYIKSNFYQSEIDAEMQRLVKSKALTQSEADTFLDNLEWKTRQWPRWATELDREELPEFGSSGILTLRSENIQEEGGKTFMRFIGKEAKPNEFEIDDPDVVKWLQEDVHKADTDPDLNGYLFLDTQSEVLQYNKSIGVEETKDYRTRIANKHARAITSETKPPKTLADFEKARTNVVGKYVGHRLCNTPSAALKSYIDEKILQEWAPGPFAEWQEKELEKAKKKAKAG